MKLIIGFLHNKLKKQNNSHLELIKEACGESKSIAVRLFGVTLFSLVGNKFMVVADWDEISGDPAIFFSFIKNKIKTFKKERARKTSDKKKINPILKLKGSFLKCNQKKKKETEGTKYLKFDNYFPLSHFSLSFSIRPLFSL